MVNFAVFLEATGQASSHLQRRSVCIFCCPKVNAWKHLMLWVAQKGGLLLVV